MPEPIASDSFPYFGDEHAMLRQTIRRFIADRVAPFADAWEEQGYVPRETLREMGALGLLGMRYAPEFGGSGLDTLANAVLAEELGRSTYGGFAVTVLVHTDMASPHLNNAGSREQMQHWMPDITAGRKITAVAMTEPDAGSDLASMRASARKVAGGYMLNGAKMFITNGVHGDLYFVAAKSGDVGRNRQMTMFAVEKGTSGFRVARALKKHGWLSSDTAELVFEDCFVPEENVIGRGRSGLLRARQEPAERAHRAVRAGAGRGDEGDRADAGLGQAAPRLRSTAMGQAGHPATACQRGWPQVEAARALLFNTAWRDTRNENVVKEVSMLKALAGTLVNEVMYDCLQFHGGMGYMRESAIERMTRDARVQSIGGGATEVMLDEVAKRI